MSAIRTAGVIGMLLALAGCAVGPTPGTRAPVEDRAPRAPATRPPAAKPAPDRPAESARVYPLPEAGGEAAVAEPPRAEPSPEPAPPVEPSVPARPPPRAGSPPAPAGGNPAVVALLDQAERQGQGGDLEQSAAALERALRIEPENAWVWHRLALTRLFQRQDEQAVQTASRSIALTADPRLQARNWRVIAQARERQGRLAEARSAAARATALEGATAPAPSPPADTRTR